MTSLPISVKEKFPLSCMQKSILLACAYQNTLGTYHIQAIVQLFEKINKPLFKQCLDEVRKKYEHFSAGVFNTNAQKNDFIVGICDDVDFLLEDLDLSILSNDEQPHVYQTFLNNELKRPFELTKPPLLRATLVKLKEHHFEFVVTFHHILFDGDSYLRVLMTLFNSYDAKRNKCTYEINSVKYPKPKYSIKLDEREKHYWQSLFSDFSDESTLSIHDEDAHKPNDIERVFQTLNENTTQNIKKFARQKRITPNIVFETAWGILLSKYSYSNDIVFSVIRLINANKQIGLNINNVPIRCKFESPDEKISDLIGRLVHQHKSFKSYQSVPLEEIFLAAGIDATNITTAIDYKPIRPCLFLKKHGDREAWKNREGYFHTNTHYDLFFEVTNDFNEGFTIKLNFKKGLFEKNDIERLLTHYSVILESMTASLDADKKLSEIVLFDHKLSNGVAKTFSSGKEITLPYPHFIVGFYQAAYHHSSQVAITHDNVSLTYEELSQYKSNCVHFLNSASVAESDTVVVFLERSIELVIFMLAISELGAVYLPIDKNTPEERLRYIIENSNAVHIVTDDKTARTFHDIGNCHIIYSDGIDFKNNNWSDQRFNSYGEDSLAYLIYTSGSTGNPKGVKIKHGALVNLLISARDTLNVKSNDVFLAITSIGFDISALEIYLPLVCGATLVLASHEEAKDPRQIIELINKHNVSILQATPSMFKLLLEADWKNDGSIKVLCGGEGLSKSIAAKLLAHKCGFWHCYGPTETTIWSTICYINSVDHINTWAPFGKPIYNTSVHIVDLHKQPLPPGIVGEIYINGKGLAAGYTDATLTESKFTYLNGGNNSLRAYRTGDLASWRPDGLLEFKGRVDDQVKINGNRVEIGDIEHAISALPYVISCAVILNKKNNLSDSLVAFIQLRESIILSQQLKIDLEKKIPIYMIPSDIRFITQMPLNQNGKLDRNKLKTLSKNLARADPNKAAPITQELKKIFSEALEIHHKTINNDSDFFALGGDSLSAFLLIIKIEKKFNIKLSLLDIHQHASVYALGHYIELLKQNSEHKHDKNQKTHHLRENISLTDFQQRLWVLDKLDRSNNAYNVSLIIKLEGPFDVTIFKQCLEILFHNHPGLFIKIQESQKEVTQSINKMYNFSEVFSFSTSPDNMHCIENTIRNKLYNTYFNLAENILFRVNLIKSTQGVHYLYLCAHHIIFDEWSAKVFLRELSFLYNNFIKAEKNTYKKNRERYLNAVYDNFIWQNKGIEYKQAGINFWVQYLKSFNNIKLPYDYPKPKVQSFEGDAVNFTLNKQISKKIKLFLCDNRITLTAFLLSVIKILIYNYTSNNDLIVGIPSTLRKSADSEELIGPFINTLTVRSFLSDDQPFGLFCASVQKNILEISQHSDVPFERIVEALQIDFDVSENPIFQIFLAVQQNYVTYFYLKGVTASKIGMPIKKSKFNLSFYFSENEENINGQIEYRVDLFERTTIKRMLKNFQHLIVQLIDYPRKSIKQHTPASLQEKKLLRLWNKTEEFIPHVTIFDLIKQSTTKYPDNVAIQYKEIAITYEQLAIKYAQLTTAILKNISSSTTCIGIFIDKCALLPVAILGVLRSGLPYIPIDPAYPKERVKYFIAHSGVSVIVCNNKTYKTLVNIINGTNSKIKLINLSKQEKLHGETIILPKMSKDQLAYIIYTSGSTGQPKGVAVEHYALLNVIHSLQRRINLLPIDNFLSVTATSFDIFALELFLPLSVGATVTFVDRDVSPNAAQLKTILKDCGISAMQATPVTWRALLDVGWQNDGTLKIICGGEALNKTLADRLLAHGNGFWHCYGPTETTIWSTCHYIQSVNNNDEWITIGKPISNTHVFILNKNMTEVPIGVEGDIYISGVGLARCYWKDIDSTNKSFLTLSTDRLKNQRVYKTGDRGYWNAQGNLMFSGRTDHQIKLHGHRIEIGEIEARLSQHPLIQEAAVTLHSEGEPFLSAHVVPKNKGSKKLDLSLLFFPADAMTGNDNPYGLCMQAVKYADENEFKAVWVPERHFNQVGGQFPNPSVLVSALSQVTKNIQLRAGSLVLPLHNPIRVAEDWAIIDNLSNGRVGLAFASGWHPQDFVLNPGAYQKRKDILFNDILTVKTLWQKKTVTLKDGTGLEREIRIFPNPVQETLPTWITAAENPETFRMAGKMGCNVLTHLLGQDLDVLQEKINLYRNTLKENDFDPDTKTVTLAVHTYLDESQEKATLKAKPYFTNYLKKHSSLLLRFNDNLNDVDQISKNELDIIIQHSLQRFLKTSSLIGSLENAAAMLDKIAQIGVDEVACLIDFGIPASYILNGLKLLRQLNNKTYKLSYLPTNEIKQYLAQHLPSYMLPHKITELSNLPKTANNKIDRRALQKIKVSISKKVHILPKTNDEKKLIEIIETLYKSKNTGLEMNLHDLGGSSIIAVQLMNEIEHRFNVKLSIQDIIEATSLGHLLKTITSKNKNSNLLVSKHKDINPIVILNKGVHVKPPLFLIHPVGGTVFCYRPLSQHLSFNRPVYGIQDPGVITKSTLFTSIEDMVDFYVHAIDRYITSHELALAGASFGGTLALEMASKLLQKGIQCSFVGLLDTWAIFPDDLKRKSYFESNMIRQHNMLSSAFKDYNVKNSKEWLELQWHRQTLLMQYRPHKLKVPHVTLFKSMDLLPEYRLIDERTNYWNDYLPQKFSVEMVPGNHETLLKPPNVAILAKKLDKCLEALTQNSTLYEKKAAS